MITWVLAFMVHSTLWLGLAWMIARARPQMHARVRETLWHTALAACLITPTAQVFAPAGASSFWALSLPSHWLESGSEEALAAAPQPDPVPVAIPADVLRALQSGELKLPARPEPQVAMVAPSFWESWTPADTRNSIWIVWGILAAGLVLRYAGRLTAMRKRISPRDLVESAPERFALTQLSRRAGLRRLPRLTESESIGSPLALGLGRRAEICIPTRALHELDHDQFCAMLGHEVAHHMRRDPLRLLGLNLLQAVFFFQPLFRVASRQLHLAAEEQCDAWGASHLEDRLAMARCLTEVASWVMPQDRRLLVAGMARRRSQLGVRVERLMDESCSFTARGASTRALASALLLAFAPWLAPSLAPATEGPSSAWTDAESRVQDPVLDRAESLRLPQRFESRLQEIEAGLKDLQATYELTLAELGPLASNARYGPTMNRMKQVLDGQWESLRMLRYLYAAVTYGDDLLSIGSPVRNTTNTNPFDSDEI